MPVSDIKQKKTPKWPFILTGLLLLLAGTGYYFYNNYLAGDRWKPLLQAQLKSLVLNSSDSLYHIEYSDFDLNLASGDATLQNFKLIPDTSVYNRLVASSKAPDNIYTLGVKKLIIKNVGARKAYQQKVLEISQIVIDQPELTIVNKKLAFNKKVKVGRTKTPYQLISKVFKKVHIDSIALNNISLNYINKSDRQTRHTALKHLDINISDVFMDSLSLKDTSRFYYTKGVQLTLHNYNIKTPDSMYLIKLKQVYFSTSQRKIVLSNVALQPRYDRKAFYKKIGKSADIFTIGFKRIAIDDLDLQSFLRDQIVKAGIMNVSNGKVDIYHDNAYKGRESLKLGTDPQQALQNVALNTKLSRLNISKINVTYSEADATSGYTGVINFNNTNGYMLNVTNDDDAKKLDPYMVAHLNTRFLGVAPLNINFKFNLADKGGAFNYSGTLGKFNGQVLDKLVKPLAMVHVKSADIEKLKFNVNANNFRARGALEFYYKNLNIELLKKVEGKPGLQKQGFISKLANTLVIEDNNPDKKGRFRPGPINYVRPATLPFFSLLYKALLEGLKPSVGFDAKTEKRVNNTVAKVSNIIDKFNKFKEARKQRREERKKQREAKKQLKETAKQTQPD